MTAPNTADGVAVKLLDVGEVGGKARDDAASTEAGHGRMSLRAVRAMDRCERGVRKDRR